MQQQANPFLSGIVHSFIGQKEIYSHERTLVKHRSRRRPRAVLCLSGFVLQTALFGRSYVICAAAAAAVQIIASTPAFVRSFVRSISLAQIGRLELPPNAKCDMHIYRYRWARLAARSQQCRVIM